MTFDDAAEVREALRLATDDLLPRPTMVADVLRGGRRRMLRRRIALVVTVVALVGVAGGAVAYGVGPARPDHVAAESLLNQATRGDLAEDKEYMSQVLAVWKGSVATMPNGGAQVASRLHGTPRVIFAAETPAGRAALVVQPVTPRPEDADPHVAPNDVALGYVDSSANGRPHLADIGVVSSVEYGTIAFLVGDHVLVALDTAGPLALSATRAYRPDGTVKREFQPLSFTNGAAVVEVPSQRLWNTLILLQTAKRPAVQGYPSYGVAIPPFGLNQVDIATRNAEMVAARARHVLPWRDARMFVGGGSWVADPTSRGLTEQLMVHGTNAMEPYEDAGCNHNVGNDSSEASAASDSNFFVVGHPWYIYGGTPDGRNLSVREMQFDDESSRVLAVLTGADPKAGSVVFGGFVDPKAVLPVRVKLPDQQGWVVADRGAALRYQRGAGSGNSAQWIDAGKDAALIPADAVAVRVTRAGGAPVTVQLG